MSQYSANCYTILEISYIFRTFSKTLRLLCLRFFKMVLTPGQALDPNYAASGEFNPITSSPSLPLLKERAPGGEAY
jgi:hypothetical protein